MTAIALDAMGGDDAPAATVRGAIEAAREGIEVALVGERSVLEAELARSGGTPPGVRIEQASDVIEMGEHAAIEARRRRDSSIYVGLSLVRRGEADAFVSAGNTGAVFATALVVLGRLRGIERPALGALLPVPAGPTLLLDAGANAECRPSHLVQFAHLGSAYMATVVGVPNPRVGLLNIGEEPTKGTPVLIETHEELAKSDLRFVGNVEGRDVFRGAVDVVVADGFTGNVMLKLAEGLIEMIFTEMRSVASSSLRTRLGGALLRPALREMSTRLDYRKYGAAPLLGVEGPVFVAHGRSDAGTIANAIRTAAGAVERGMIAALAAVPTERLGSRD
ncbi:MAG: phosphate acyltransferase PlsX [Dehalococcoidia bacterium]|nr:phosphate acyltransferase PlsX [Dehalococcoidia bacterium]HRC61754.1 phosphate acyltransferase PlsX [Dehalococcoidia bacterium]